MKFPRGSVGWLMALVGYAAANFAAVRGLFVRPSIWKEVCFFGVLPMANLLAVGALPWLRSGPHQAAFGGFRVGFEACGVLSVAAFLALSLTSPVSLYQLPLTIFKPYLNVSPGVGFASTALLIFFGPQLAFAVLGGLLSRSFSSRAARPGHRTSSSLSASTCA